MTTDLDRLLRERFAGSTPAAEPPDWADVVTRSRRHADRPRASTHRRALLLAAALVGLLVIAGSAIAISGTTTGIDAIDELLDKASRPPESADPNAPPPGVRPVPGSLSEPLSFTHDGATLTAIGFQSETHMICSAFVDPDASPERPVGGVGCLSARGVHDFLADSPVHVFGEGGYRIRTTQGFARADVVAISSVGEGGPHTIALSEPWRPEPWDGEPIRFFYSVTTDPTPDDSTPIWQGLRLRVELANGKTVEVGP